MGKFSVKKQKNPFCLPPTRFWLDLNQNKPPLYLFPLSVQSAQKLSLVQFHQNYQNDILFIFLCGSESYLLCSYLFTTLERGKTKSFVLLGKVGVRFGVSFFKRRIDRRGEK